MRTVIISNQLKMTAAVVIFGSLIAVAAPDVLAGAGGSEFDDVWTQVKDWTQGTLGRIAAGGMVLVGIIGGISRQSLMPFATGVGGAMGLYNSPTVIESIMSATLTKQLAVVEAIQPISNGLL